MTVIDDLLQTAYEDTQLLLRNDELGDVLAVPRDVDFLLRAKDEQKARTVCSFITDNQYGKAEVRENGGEFTILVIVHMPVTQNLICSVSALMCCLSKIFDLEYDGWGSLVQREA